MLLLLQYVYVSFFLTEVMTCTVCHMFWGTLIILFNKNSKSIMLLFAGVNKILSLTSNAIKLIL